MHLIAVSTTSRRACNVLKSQALRDRSPPGAFTELAREPPESVSSTSGTCGASGECGRFSATDDFARPGGGRCGFDLLATPPGKHRRRRLQARTTAPPSVVASRRSSRDSCRLDLQPGAGFLLQRADCITSAGQSQAATTTNTPSPHMRNAINSRRPIPPTLSNQNFWLRRPKHGLLCQLGIGVQWQRRDAGG